VRRAAAQAGKVQPAAGAAAVAIHGGAA